MIIGTAGHIDHGKTSLVKALTGVDTDRLKEEKARGISIDLGFAYLPAADGSVLAFVDVPGHERFVHTMLAGASGIDFALLVVAADDGVMPQTREHLAIVELLGIRRGAVALAKADLATGEDRARIAAEIAAVLASTALAGAPIIPVSVVTGEGVAVLGQHLVAKSRAFGRRTQRGGFRLAVDRCFTLAGAGTVVTGTVLSGEVKVGDRLVVSPSGLAARVRSIHAQNKVAERGVAGDRCALNLAGDGVAKEAIRRGDVVLEPRLHAPTDRIDATLLLLASEQKPVSQWMPARLHHAAVETGARVVLLEDEPLVPGSEKKVQLVLDRPIAAAAGDRFVLRDTTSQRTIGGGRFLDLRAPARRRRTPARLAQLAALTADDTASALLGLLAAPPHHVDLTGFGRDHALSEAELAAVVTAPGVVRIPAAERVHGLNVAAWRRLSETLRGALEDFHEKNRGLVGMGADRLRLLAEPRLPPAAFTAALAVMAKDGAIVLDGAAVRLPGHAARLSDADAALWSRIEPLLGGAERFRPPRTRDIAGTLGLQETEVRRLLKLIGRLGRLTEVAHDHFFLRTAVAEMVRVVVDLASRSEKGEFTAAQFRDRLDNGRKVAIQILEFLDRHGVTLRRGDLRRVNAQRISLFAAASGSDNDSSDNGRERDRVIAPDFKSGRGRETVLGGFDSHSLPPNPGRRP